VGGGSKGLGRAIADELAAEGAYVTICSRTQSDLEKAEAEIRAATGTEIMSFAGDLDKPETITSLVAATVERFGRLDILVNNAGLAFMTPIDAADYEQVWAMSLDVLLTSHTRTVRAALPHLRRSDAARIVNVASTEGLGATRFASAYTAAKHGVIGLTRALAVELGREGITVNCICPGPIRTGITDSIPEKAKQEFARRRTILGRYGEPEEVAHATLALVLPAASYITGAYLVVDGGVTVRNA
jgi:3-oxoacyl-[acyl-carrier protein] reductase